MDPHLKTRLRLSLFAIAAATLTAMACESTTGPDRQQIGVLIGSDSSAPNVQGTWLRSVSFIDEFGFVNQFDTIWEFDRNGNATRSEITASLTLGTADTVITEGVWTTDGPLVVVTFLQPSPLQLRLDALVQGNVMFLGGEEFRRVE